MNYHVITSSFVLLLSMASAATAQSDSRLNQNLAGAPSPRGNSPVSGSSRYFDIYLGDKRIGFYEANKIRRGSTTEYQATSETVVRLLGEIKVGYDLSCTFENGLLTKSRVRSYRNGNLKSETVVTWTGTEYLIDIDGETSTESTPVRMSSIQLYFEGPPEDVNRVFSEREAKMKQVRKVNERQYLVADPGKSKGTEFVYKNASVTEVNIAFALGSFTLIRPGKDRE